MLYASEIGWGGRIRTPALRSRAACPTSRRLPKNSQERKILKITNNNREQTSITGKPITLTLPALLLYANSVIMLSEIFMCCKI